MDFSAPITFSLYKLLDILVLVRNLQYPDPSIPNSPPSHPFNQGWSLTENLAIGFPMPKFQATHFKRIVQL